MSEVIVITTTFFWLVLITGVFLWMVALEILEEIWRNLR